MASRAITNRIPELDGLRGIAIAAVIFFHIGPLLQILHPIIEITFWGWSGVDLFFVLSGFLIGGILIEHRESETYFSAFYARRFFRIVPLYFALVLIYALAWLDPPARGTIAHYFCSPMPWYTYFTFTNNFWISSHNEMGVYLAPTWSLAIEEQFYLMLPLVVKFLRPRFLLPVICGLASAVFIARVSCGYFGWALQNSTYVLPWFREDALLIGVICAMLHGSGKARRFLAANRWMLYCLLMVFAALLFKTGVKLGSPRTPLMMYGLTIVALFYGTLLLLTLTAPPYMRVLRFRPLMELGKVSYFVYLTHIIVIWSLKNVLDATGPHSPLAALAYYCMALGGLFFVAQLSWRFFESHMIKFGHRFQFTYVSDQTCHELSHSGKDLSTYRAQF